MADDAYAPTPDAPAVAPPSPFSPPTVQVEPTPTNPEAMRDTALSFVAQHKAAMDARTREVDNIFSKQQLNVQNMSKILDDTAATLKGAKQGQMNMPLIALGAGMMSSPGSFGTQIGAGLKAMVPVVEHERAQDEDLQFKLAQLAMRRAGVENAPLEEKLAYMRALQTGDQAGMRAAEAAMIRASGQTSKQDVQQAQLAEKSNRDAMQQALNQIDKLGKDYFSTPQEREDELIRRYVATARSLKVPEDSIAAMVSARKSGFSQTAVKGGFTTPGDTDKDKTDAQTLGLGPKPSGYVYDAYTSPTDKRKAYETERANYEKERKLFSSDADKAQTELAGLNQAEAILKRNPGITGPTLGGLGPNKWQLPNAARNQLESIFAGNQIHSVPQGQGAISDYERTLFRAANPNMDAYGDANMNMINARRVILNDQIAKRDFVTKYFEHYKTSTGANEAWAEYAKSPEGQAAFIDPETGMVKLNPNRVSWQDYMRKKWPDQPAKARGGQFARGGQYAGGGPIHLGDEWDD